MRAVIDIGTNSVRFLRQVGTKLKEDVYYTRLGEDTHLDGQIKPKAYERTLAAIKTALAELESEAILITATSALREAKNREAILARFYEDLGREIIVLSGEDEARVNYLGARQAFLGEALVLDIGGGSTEVSTKEGERIKTLSLPIGALRLKAFASAYEPLETYLSPFLEFGKLDLPLVGTGGTITSLALIAQNLSAYDEAKIHGYLLTKEKLEKMSLAILENPSVLLSPLPEKRRDILPQGLEILLNMMAILEKTSLFVSTRDGLYGLQSEGLSVR